MHKTLFLTAALMACAGPVSAQVTDSALFADARKWVDLLNAGDWAAAEAMVVPVNRGQMSAAVLESSWKQIRAALGDLTSTSPMSVTAVDTFKSVVLRADFANQPMALRIAFNPAREIAGFWIDQLPPSGPAPTPPYADPATFTEEEVVVGAEPWQLPATLTIPKAPGRHPVIVLVHGSGPQDRDETVGGTRVFRDLAWGLAHRGIAVLRYEKRTKAHATRMTGEGVTVEQEVIEDALAALELVRGHASIDPARVYVLGHSLGGQLAPEIARRDGRLAGAILMAAPARRLDVILLAQLEYIKALPSNSAPETQAQFDQMIAQAQRLVSGEAADSESIMGAPVAYFRDLIRRDGVAEAVKLDRPILVLQGERDYQITMEDFALWQKALGSRKSATLRSFPALNHLFVAGEGQPSPGEYARPGFVSVDVIEAIAGWVEGKD